MPKRMWALMLHLTMNMWGKKDNFKEWDDGTWNTILDECEKNRIDTIVLDIGDGMEYKSHPEISVEGAWSHERMREEIAKCKSKGITLIPKLNFAAVHDQWLGEYQHMLSTSVYYKVCEDLIDEVCEVFDNPTYFHLGMDEESYEFAKSQDLVVYRQGNLIWKDLHFLVDCVRKHGSTPWIWHNWLFEHPEEYRKHFAARDMILSPYHYNAFREEHFTPVSINSNTAAYYSSGDFADMNIEFVEQDPFFERFHAQAIPNAELGYKYVPCASVFNECKWNHQDLVEHFRDNAPDASILGYITAPWFSTTPDKLDKHLQSIHDLAEARAMFYPED